MNVGGGGVSGDEGDGEGGQFTRVAPGSSVTSIYFEKVTDTCGGVPTCSNTATFSSECDGHNCIDSNLNPRSEYLVTRLSVFCMG